MSWVMDVPKAAVGGVISTGQRYVIYGLLIALCAGGLAYFTHVNYLRAKVATLKLSLKGAEVTIGKLKDDLQTAVETNLKLTTSLEAQNAAVAVWQQEAADREARSAQALEEAKKINAKLERKYNKLLNSPPADPINECASLDLRLTDYLKVRSEP